MRHVHRSVFFTPVDSAGQPSSFIAYTNPDEIYVINADYGDDIGLEYTWRETAAMDSYAETCTAFFWAFGEIPSILDDTPPE